MVGRKFLVRVRVELLFGRLILLVPFTFGFRSFSFWYTEWLGLGVAYVLLCPGFFSLKHTSDELTIGQPSHLRGYRDTVGLRDVGGSVFCGEELLT